MTNLTTRLYQNMLLGDNLALNLQRDILNHALKTKDYSLASSLLEYKTLDESIAQTVLNHSDLELRYLYLTKLNSKPKELIKLLKEERTNTLHHKLATSSKTSPKVLSYLVSNKPNPTLALKLLINSATLAEDKLIVIKKLLTPGYIALDKNKNPKISAQEIIFEIRSSEDYKLFELIAGDLTLIELTKDLLPTLELNPNLGRAILSLYGKVISFIEINPKAKEQNYQYAKVISSILASPKLPLESREEIVRQLKEVNLTNLNPKVEREFTKLSSHLSTGNTLIIEKFQEEIMLANSPQELKKLCVLITQSNVGNEITNLQYDELLLKVLAKPTCPRDLADTIFENFDPHQFSEQSLASLIPDPVLYGQVLAYYFYDNLADKIELSREPKVTYLALLKHSTDYATQLKTELFYSKYWESELFALIPVSILANQELPKELESSMVNLITEKLTTPSSWEVFTTLSKDFQGSLGELLNISSKI